MSSDAAARLAERARTSAGFDFLRATRDGELPPAPIQELIGFRLVEVDEGRAVFVATPDERHYNPIGTVHGGIAGTLLDSAMGAAVHTTLPVGGAYATAETSFNLVRAITVETGEISAEGTVVHRGGRIATSSGRLTRTSDGKLLAHGTSTCVIL